MDYVIKDIFNLYTLFCKFSWMTNTDQCVVLVAKNFIFPNKKSYGYFYFIHSNPIILMQGNQMLGYWMEVTRPDWNFMFVIYYLISKLFDCNGFYKTEKHYISYFLGTNQYLTGHRKPCFFFQLFRGQNTRAENPVSCPWLSRWTWIASFHSPRMPVVVLR